MKREGEVIREPGQKPRIRPMDRSQFKCQDCLDYGDVLGPDKHPIWPTYVPCPTCNGVP